MSTADSKRNERDNIDDLLDRWQEAWLDGLDPSPEAICPPDCPQEVVRELARRIEQRKKLRRFLPESPAAFHFDEGAVVPGTAYRLVKELGKGAFGRVWKAQHFQTGAFAALKFCRDEGAAILTLRNERDKLQRIKDECGDLPGIVRLLDFSLDGACPFIALEYIEGPKGCKDFADYLRNRFKRGDRISPEGAAEVIHDLAAIMAPVHALDRPIAHRDLKPENILITSEAPLGFKITDFGIGVLAVSTTIAKLTGTDLARDWTGTGTPLYMSPEQFKPGHIGHPADDVFALGVIWYQLLTGDLESRPRPGNSWVADLPSGMTDPQIEVLASCFEKQEQRPQTASELASRIKARFTLPTVTVRAHVAEIDRLKKEGEGWMAFVRATARTHQKLWNECVDNKLPEALWLNGLCFENGFNAEADLGKAKRLFEAAAESGYANAQYEVGLYTRYGFGGAQRDFAWAMTCFLQAAQQGHRDAEWELGLCLLEGGDGIAPDPKGAVHWMKRAASNGHAEASYRLGVLLSEGREEDAVQLQAEET
jgi:serine/threonine protein kinase